MVSKILITTGDHFLEGFTTLSSLKLIPSSIKKIDYLVFHSSTETDEAVMSGLANLSVENLYYINDNPSEKLKAYFVGTGNAFVRDEVYLEDIDLFNEATSDPDIGKEVSIVGDLTVLEQFSERIANGDTNFSPKYLELIKATLSSAVNRVNEADKDIVLVSQAAVGIFDEFQRQSEGMRATAQQLQESLIQYKNAYQGRPQASVSPTGMMGIQQYPSVTYDGISKAILIKDLGNTPYLVSFVLGLKRFIETRNAGSKVGVLVLLPPGKVWEQHYSNIDGSSFITNTNTNNVRNLISRNVIFLNHPLQKILRQIFHQSYDYLIVLDRTTNSTDLLVKPNTSKRNAKDFYASSSKRIVEGLKLNKSKCFSSGREWDGALFTVPAFQDYGNRIQSREHQYLKECSDMYRKMVF